MSQTQHQEFLSRFCSATWQMEGLAAESIEQRLTSIERGLAAINRRLADSETPGPSEAAPENQ